MIKSRTKIEAAISIAIITLLILPSIIGDVTITDTAITDDTFGTIVSFDNDYIDISNLTISNNASIGNIFLSEPSGSSPGYWNGTIPYIITGDGTTYIATDTNLQTAIWSQNSSSNKIVSFPSMTIDDNISLIDGLTFQGHNPSVLLTFSNLAGINCTFSNITVKDFRCTGDAIFYTNANSDIENIQFLNIYAYDITGSHNYVGTSYEPFITLYADDCTIDTVVLHNVHVNDSSLSGFIFDDNTGANKNNWDAGTLKNLQVSDCSFCYCGDGTLNDYAVGFDLRERGVIDGAIINNCIFEYNWESGFHMEVDSKAKNVVISDCISSYNGQKGGGSTYGCGFLLGNNTELNNCVIEQCRLGIRTSNNNTINNCKIKNIIGTGWGIRLNDVHNVEIYNSDIFGTGRGISSSSSSNITVSDTKINESAYCFYLNNVTDMSIFNVDFLNGGSTTYGVYSQYGGINRTDITDCNFENIDYCIEIGSTVNSNIYLDILSNTFIGNSGFSKAIQFDSTDIFKVNDNDIFSPFSGTGIKAYGNNGTIHDNTIKGCDVAIQVKYHNISVQSNLISNASIYGIRLLGGTINAYVFDNIILDSPDPINNGGTNSKISNNPGAESDNNYLVLPCAADAYTDYNGQETFITGNQTLAIYYNGITYYYNHL